LLEHWIGNQGQAGDEFVKEKLNDLAHRRTYLESGPMETESRNHCKPPDPSVVVIQVFVQCI
jgi:hypothetical protein